MKKIDLLFVLTLLLLSQVVSARAMKLSSYAKNRIIGVRVTDVADHLSREVSKLKLHEVDSFLRANSEELFHKDADVEKIHNIFFTKLPEILGQYGVLNLIAFLEYEKNDFTFEKIKIIYLLDKVESAQVEVQEVTPLKKTRFKIQAALAARKIIFTEKKSHFKMIFPLGVGSFDEGVLNNETSILTPRFKNAYVDKRTAIEKRKYPRYFSGKPFIRIMTSKSKGSGTAIGFHIQPWEKYFVRAFDSHGCIRMQESDLYAFDKLLRYGPTDQLPLNVTFNIDEKMEHPYPKRDKPYKTVLNVGKNGKRDFKLDRDKLVQLKRVSGSSAPVDKLIDRDADDYRSIFNYDVQKRVAEKKTKHEKMCRAKYIVPTELPNFDESRYVVNRSDYKVYRYNYYYYEDYYDAKMSREKNYKSDLKDMKKNRSHALEDFKDEIEDLKEGQRDAYEKCLEKNKRKCTAKDRFSYFFIHGSTKCE